MELRTPAGVAACHHCGEFLCSGDEAYAQDGTDGSVLWYCCEECFPLENHFGLACIVVIPAPSAAKARDALDMFRKRANNNDIDVTVYQMTADEHARLRPDGPYFLLAPAAPAQKELSYAPAPPDGLH